MARLHACEHDGARLDWLAPRVYVCPECAELYWIAVGRGNRPTDKHAVRGPAALALASRVPGIWATLDALLERNPDSAREQRRSA